ncbi:hypothetical protein N5I87_04575 [Ralstonia sp. CHL-2022]|uniref:Uncharacterized protein n=1 Tax=Ralstonia mojiangensis TaxID=2953895 RepID=A0AAE3I0C8_9RALS|nr:hypothetical protein [Ralstonia mojiangensis]MCT7315269.1 hypothetical protein [Ralstonia mojiangensis]
MLPLILQTLFNAISRVVRLENFPDKAYSDDPEVDKLIDRSTRKICGAQIDETESLRAIVEHAKNNAVVIRLLELREKTALQITKFGKPDAQSIIAPSSMVNVSVKDIWMSFNDWRYAHKIARNARKSIESRKAMTIDFSGADAGQLLGLVSAGLVVGGFFYQKIFFSRLGVDVTKYLSVSDYLSASIGVLSVAITSVVFNVVILFLSTLSVSKYNKDAAERLEKGRQQPLLAAMTVMAVAMAFGWFLNRRMFWETLAPAVWIGGLIFIPPWASVYFKRPLLPIFVILFFTFFGAQVYSKAELNALALRSGSYFSGDADKVLIDWRDTPILDANNVSLIESASNFTILYDRQNKRVWFVPKEKIKAIYRDLN